MRVNDIDMIKAYSQRLDQVCDANKIALLPLNILNTRHQNI